MGRRSQTGGVAPRGRRIQVTFAWQKQRCREPLELSPTPPNMAYARRLVVEIQQKIGHGTFTYSDYFPNSPRAAKPTAKPMVRAVGESWIKTLSHLAYSTVEGYEGLLNTHVYPELGPKPIDTVSFTELAGIASHVTGKTRNNLLVTVRGIWDLAIVEGHITVNPALRLRNVKVVDPEPDPFELPEVDLILDHISKKYGDQVECYFGAGFFAGFRTSEHIELKWTDLDWKRHIARVQRARVRRRAKQPKTDRARNHELNSKALGYLERMRAYTQLAGEYVFLDPVTRKPYIDDQTPRRRYWEPTLKALGIRYREPYQMRHTYATTAIMAGANPTWVAKQMGNSPRTMFKHYARWIEAADRGREQQKVEAFLVANPVANGIVSDGSGR